MARGTIHAIDDDLFLVEGEWPTTVGASVPGPAVFRSGSRVYLLDTGSGREHRSALEALTMSFGPDAEVVLVNSGTHPGLTGNNDLAQRVRGCTVTPVELRQVKSSVSDVGGVTWPGWRLDGGLVALLATTRTERLAFYLPTQRTLLLPDELVLAPGWPGSDIVDVRRVAHLMLSMIDARLVSVVSVGFGAPLAAEPARDLLFDLTHDVKVGTPAVLRARAGIGRFQLRPAQRTQFE